MVHQNNEREGMAKILLNNMQTNINNQPASRSNILEDYAGDISLQSLRELDFCHPFYLNVG